MTETYMADLVGFGDKVDIMPYARAVVEECPYPHDISAYELAELTASRKYINVAMQDRVAGRMIDSMVRQLFGRVAFYHHRKEQLLDPDLRKVSPYLELMADIDICEQAASMTGRFLTDDELQPIPLSGCWGQSCFCTYRLSSVHDVRRDGRMSADGTALPRPAVEATFSGVVDVTDDEEEGDDG